MAIKKVGVYLRMQLGMMGGSHSFHHSQVKTSSLDSGPGTSMLVWLKTYPTGHWYSISARYSRSLVSGSGQTGGAWMSQS